MRFINEVLPQAYWTCEEDPFLQFDTKFFGIQDITNKVDDELENDFQKTESV